MSVLPPSYHEKKASTVVQVMIFPTPQELGWSLLSYKTLPQQHRDSESPNYYTISSETEMDEFRQII